MGDYKLNRSLAARTSSSTSEIAGMIQKIQNDTKSFVEAMRQGRGEVEAGVQQAEEAKKELAEIVAASEQCLDLVRMIAVATEEQSTTMAHISTTMNVVSGLSSDSHEESSKISVITQELSTMSDALNSAVSAFKTGT